MDNKDIQTKCIQSGYKPKNGEARVLPLFQSTTYYYEKADDMAALFDLQASGYFYSRLANPTVGHFEQKVADLEGGVAAVGCSSGQSASFITIMNVCKAGDNIISLSAIYGGTFNLFNVTLRKFGIDVRFVTPDASVQEIESLIDDNTKLIFGETIANPAMVVLDFDKFAKISKKYGILFAVDNTLATPIITRPFEFGANLIIHSSTKYLDGHATSVGGLVVEANNFIYTGNPRYAEFNEVDESYHGIIYSKDAAGAPFCTKARTQLIRDIGCIMSPFNAYMTNFGAETLALRMKQHSENALKVAKFLNDNDKVEWINYPHLKDNSQNKLAKKYMKIGGGGMVTFGIKGGKSNATKFIDSLKLVFQATHIADIRSCVLHPATTTHRQLSDSDLVKAGVQPNLIRLSVGCENVEDIINDIAQALQNV